MAREEGVAALTRQMASGSTPSFAPPFLVHDGITVAQVAAILLYLGPRLGLVPENEAGRLWCHQIQLTITDLVAEVHDTHHPISKGLYYEDQKLEARRRTEAFVTERIPKYLGWLDGVAERNPSGPAHMVGNALSTADLSVFQVVEGLHYAFPKAMRSFGQTHLRLAAIHASVQGQPGVTAYLASERRIPFNENGIFRAYPELDV